jgi:hypothetical protein
VLALNLAGEADAGESALRELFFLGLRHLLRLAAHELDAARRAARVAAACMQDVDARVLLDGKDEPFAFLNVNWSEPLYGQSRHAPYVNVSG